MGSPFSKRPAVKQRPAPSPYSAVVDTTGMDPEMKPTLTNMRGPLGSAGNDPFAGLKSAVAGAKKLIFGSHGKK